MSGPDELRRLMQRPAGAEFLGDLERLWTHVGWGDCFVSKGFDGYDKVRILGEEHGEFLFAHSPSELVYAIPFGMRRFTAIGAILAHPESQDAEVRFVVFLDGRPVFTATHGVGDPEGTAVEVSLPLGSKTLGLKILAGPDGRAAANTAWAFPYFHRHE